MVRSSDLPPPAPGDAWISRVPPHSVEAEIALIGACLLEPEHVQKLASVVTPSDFYRSQNARIWNVMAGMSLAGTPPDPTLVLAEIERQHLLDDIGGREYLQSLVRSVASAANAQHYAKIVVEKAVAREAIRSAQQVILEAYDGLPAAQFVEDAALRFRILSASHASATAKPVTWKSASDLASSRSMVKWIWRGYIAEGALTLFVGQPKSGKSTLGYALAAASQRGDESFCGFPIAPDTKFVYLSEESDPTVREKTQRFEIDDSSVRFASREDAFPPRPLRTMCEVAVEEAKRIGAKVVVVDTLAVWAHLAPDAEKDAGAMQRALEPLLWVAAQGFAVVIIHHMRKADGEQGTSVRGSSALLATVDVLLELRRFGGEDESAGPKNARMLTAISRFEETPEEIVVELDGDRFRAKGTASEARQASKAERVLSLLARERKWMTKEEVMEAIGGRKSDVVTVLSSLVEAGSVNRLGTGRAGAAFLFAVPGVATPPGSGAVS